MNYQSFQGGRFPIDVKEDGLDVLGPLGLVGFGNVLFFYDFVGPFLGMDVLLICISP
jgi:hypothetical protein